MLAEDQMPSTDPPQLLAFYQDVWDDDGTALGWRPIAWGLRFADGSALSVPAGGTAAVTLWHSVEDASASLDAEVDVVEPRRWLGHDLRTPDTEGDDRGVPPEASAPPAAGTSGGVVR